MVLGTQEGVGAIVFLALDVRCIETGGKKGVEVEGEMRQEVHKVDKLGLPGAGSVAHPAEGGCVVCCNSEYVPVMVRDCFGRGLALGKEDEHHEVDIDDDAYEFIHVDVVLRKGWVGDKPDGQVTEDHIGETPLEGEAKGEASHGSIAGIGESGEVGVS